MHNQIVNNQLEQLERLTREAVREVFQSMLSLDIENEPPPAALPPDAEGEVVGSVGFIGDTSGVICLCAGVGVARALTARMLAIAEAEVDSGDMINDAVGELSNMVVGYVKSRLCDGGLPCTITIPSIIRGQKLSVESANGVTRSVLGFHTGDQHLLVEVFLKQQS